MKRILTAMCALAIVMAGASLPAHAAQAPEKEAYYPIDVKEYLEGDSHRISKVYQLSLLDDPAAIPTGEFERDGRRYFLLDMTRKDEVGVETKPHTHTATLASDTDDMEEILQRLESTMEVTTEDGYTGLLQLDHTTVKVAADGYATKSQALSASRTYPNLSDADLSLIPKTIEEKGKTLTLADVEWISAYQTVGSEGAVLRYSAAASYTGSTSYRVATGYTVTADYAGEVAKAGCDVVTYTAIFGSTALPEHSPDAESGQEGAPESPDLKLPLAIAGVVLVLGGGGLFLWKKKRGT